ncbi:MAG: iron-containing alcohol dehydrogenase [Thermoplasmata archaeon]
MSLYELPRKIYFQRDIIDDLSDILAKEGISNILLITDGNIFKRWKGRIEKALGKVKWELFSDVFPEPQVSYVESVAKKFSGKGYDGIVAIGGGSVMDFAKSIAVKISDSSLDLSAINPFVPLNLSVKLIAVPTTSGTGSDVSFGVVLTDSEGKLALGNYDLVPFIDILDPSITPEDRGIILPTGVDAFVHSFESLASNTSTPFTDALAEKAIELIHENLSGALENEEKAKDAMHIAATMAGMAFSNSGTALAHALGHSFGSVFHITHGTSVGLFLLPSMKFNSQDEVTRRKYLSVARRLGFSSIDSLFDDIERLFTLVGQPVRVREIQIEREKYMGEIDHLAQLALRDSELAFNPVVVGEGDLKALFMENY